MNDREVDKQFVKDVGDPAKAAEDIDRKRRLEVATNRKASLLNQIKDLDKEIEQLSE